MEFFSAVIIDCQILYLTVSRRLIFIHHWRLASMSIDSVQKKLRDLAPKVAETLRPSSANPSMASRPRVELDNKATKLYISTPDGHL